MPFAWRDIYDRLVAWLIANLGSYIPPTRQPDAVLNQANPVSGQLYTVLATAPNTRVRSIMAYVVWTVQPSPLEVIVTVDGQVVNYSVVNPATTTNYMAEPRPQYAENAQTLVTWNANKEYVFLLEGRSVLIQARTTGGTVQTLFCRVKCCSW